MVLFYYRGESKSTTEHGNFNSPRALYVDAKSILQMSLVPFSWVVAGLSGHTSKKLSTWPRSWAETSVAWSSPCYTRGWWEPVVESRIRDREACKQILTAWLSLFRGWRVSRGFGAVLENGLNTPSFVLLRVLPLRKVTQPGAKNVEC